MANPSRPGRTRRWLRVSAVLFALSLASLLIPAVDARPVDIDFTDRNRRAAAELHAQSPPPAAEARSLVAPVWDGGHAPVILSAAAAVIDSETGALLFGLNPHRRLPPASLTKIVTAIVALEYGDLETIVTVDVDGAALARGTDSSIMGLRPGDRLSLRDLLYGMMLPFGNDAAIAIAGHIAGNEADFVALMNAKVTQLGLENTRFINVHGLHDPAHSTTAFDITQLSAWAMHDAEFRRIVATRVWTVNGSRFRVSNLNPLVWQQGGNGVKTGWHEQAGMTLVGSADRQGHRLIVSDAE